MWIYILRRLLYAIPILIGVNLLTFFLFFIVNAPADMARVSLGEKHVTPKAIDNWIENHGYNKPLFLNTTQTGKYIFTDTLFFEKTWKLFLFDYGISDGGRDITQDISERFGPSLSIAIPALFFEVFLNIVLALIIVFFRRTFVEMTGVIVLVAMMSISALFYIITGQYLIGKLFNWVPISGYENGLFSFKFVILPIFVSVIASFGSGARWYRTLLLEEMNQDYIRTARAKGLSNVRVLFVHALKNAMIPILTGIVVLIPSLFMGSLLLESFFSIPGLGSYTIDAIAAQDFAVVRSMVFLGSFLYIIGLLLTDISYMLVDPRIRFNR